jgi:hypothetical protein
MIGLSYKFSKPIQGTREMKIKALVLAAGMASFLAMPAFSHHSFSMFDHEKTVTVSGLVKEFEYTNPHAWLHIMSVDEKTGRPVEWSFEMGGVGQITAQGWKPDSVKPGDKISVQMHPLKDGSRGGQYLNATLADGRSFKNPGNAANDNVVR